MQDILTCAMGLDVHRDIIVACLVKGAVDAEPEGRDLCIFIGINVLPREDLMVVMVDAEDT